MREYQSCPHKDCLYRAGFGAPNECDYAGITGRCRIAGLTREQAQDKQNCPKYKPKGPKKKRSPSVRPQHLPRAARYDWGLGRYLYSAGDSDREIAKELGCSHQAVGEWRRRQGLPANRCKERT